jgi:protein-tyrosine phosphatase
MDRDNLRDLRRLAPSRSHADTVRLMLEFDPEAESLDVPDPYYGSAGDFDEVLDLLEPACRGLVEHLHTVP